MELNDDVALLDKVIHAIFREELDVFKGFKQQQCCYPEIKIGWFLLHILLSFCWISWRILVQSWLATLDSLILTTSRSCPFHSCLYPQTQAQCLVQDRHPIHLCWVWMTGLGQTPVKHLCFIFPMFPLPVFFGEGKLISNLQKRCKNNKKTCHEPIIQIHWYFSIFSSLF